MPCASKAFFKSIRVKSFPFKPMTPEEAILQMNLLGHSFFAFTDAQTLEVAVVYKRKEGDYGLIVQEKYYYALGTVGGGNHYCEIGEKDGCYTFSIHCGSRNFGKKICEYWENMASGKTYDKKKFKELSAEIKKNSQDKTLIPGLIEERRKKKALQ